MEKKVATVRKGGVSAKQTESHNEAINDNRDGCRIPFTDTDRQIQDCISQFIFKETGDSHFASLVTSWNAELSSSDVLQMMITHLKD